MNPADMYINRGPVASSSNAAANNNAQRGAGAASASASVAEDFGGQRREDMTRKELETEKKDIELGELLELMGDWKPIVSHARRARVRHGTARLDWPPRQTCQTCPPPGPSAAPLTACSHRSRTR